MISFLYSQRVASGKRRTDKELRNNYVWLTSNLYFIKIMEETSGTQALKRVLAFRGVNLANVKEGLKGKKQRFTNF